MTEYKLHYFDLRGLGEAIRLIFAYANQPYAERIITMEDWPDYKPNYKYGRLPVLEVDGKQLAQSAVICRYLGEKFGLAGKDEWERAHVNEIIDFHKDAYGDLAPYYYRLLGYGNKGLVERDPADLRKELFLPTSERHFPQYVRLLKESGSGFLAPSGLTFVDFIVADYFEHWVNKFEPELMKENYPEIVTFVDKIHLLPELQHYLKNRRHE
ncbi:putative glutathione S-transferase 5 [Ditylenchus destructor]|nr:putative glutathione S-transferase 5 [Ditylenchus destructor]